MTRAKTKQLMFIYLDFFLLLSFVSIKSDYENNYNLFVLTYAWLHYLMLSFGIVLYASGIQTAAIKVISKYSFPFLIAYFVVSWYIDSQWGQHRDVDLGGVAGEIAIFLFGILMFFPAWRASYILGYKTLHHNETRNATNA